MNTGLSISLRNDLSGPARAVASSLSGIASEARQATAALSGLERQQKTVAQSLNEAPSAVAAMRKQQLANVAAARAGRGPRRATRYSSVASGVASPVKPSAVAAPSSVGAAFSGSAGAAAGVMAVVAAVGLLTVKMAQLTASAGQWLVAMQVQRDASLLSFKLMFGGVEQASGAFRRAIALSQELGQSSSETVSAFQSLGAQGMKVSEIETMVKSLADLRLVAPNIQADRAISAIGQIMSKGKLGLEELQGQLGDSANLNVGYVKDALGEILKVRGKTEAEIRSGVDKAISAGKVDSSTGIRAVQMAISRMAGGGNPGEAAKEASRSLGSVLSQLKSLPTNLALSFELPGTQPILAFGKNIIEALRVDGGPAKALMSSVGGLFASVTKILFGDLPGKSGIEKAVYAVADALDTVDTVVNHVAPVAKAVLSGLGEGFSEVYKAVGPVAEEVAKVFGSSVASKGEAIATVARLVGKGFAYMAVAAGAVVAAIGAVSAVVPALVGGLAYGAIALGTLIVDGVASAVGAILSFGTQAYEAGMNIVQGVANGITAGLALVGEAATSIGSTAVSAVTSALSIQSPSRVMAELGGHTAAGFAVGVNDNAGPVDAAMASLVAPPSSVAMPSSREAGAPSVSITINVDGAGRSGQEIGEHIARLLPAALRDAFDQMGAELGYGT